MIIRKSEHQKILNELNATTSDLFKQIGRNESFHEVHVQIIEVLDQISQELDGLKKYKPLLEEVNRVKGLLNHLSSKE